MAPVAGPCHSGHWAHSVFARLHVVPSSHFLAAVLETRDEGAIQGAWTIVVANAIPRIMLMTLLLAIALSLVVGVQPI